MLAKQSAQTLLAQSFEIGPVFYAHLPELRRGHLAHAKELLDGQRLKKGRGLLERDHREAIGFVGIRGQFGQELAVVMWTLVL